MSQPPPCGDPTCPVLPATPDLVSAVSTYAMPAGTSLARGHPHRYAGNSMPPAGAGKAGRFSPLPGVSHTYVARIATAALLETAFRDVSPPARTVFRLDIAPWGVSDVVTTAAMDLADLRDSELERLGIARGSVAASRPRHYPCTGRWAGALHTAGHHGIIWHSRQADLHRDHIAGGGLGATLLSHGPIEVAVLWAPPAPSSPLRLVGQAQRLGDEHDISELVIELAALLGIVIES